MSSKDEKNHVRINMVLDLAYDYQNGQSLTQSISHNGDQNRRKPTVTLHKFVFIVF